MSISVEYNFTLDTGYSPPAPVQPADLWVLDSIRLFKLADGQHLALNTHNLKRVVIRDNVLPLFPICSRFRTLTEHCDAVLKEMTGPKPSREEILAVLRHLQASGVMVSAEQWLERFPSAPAEPVAGAEWALVITTCDRPALLQRLLDSAICHITPDTRPTVALLLDDSRKPDSIRANRKAWSEWLERCGLSGEYWGRSERAQLCRTLAKWFPEDGRTIDWLLSPEALAEDSFTIGQGRNLALLLTAGLRLLLLDDDCYLEPRRHPFCENRLRVGPVPVEAIPYADRDALSSDSHALDLNPLEEHLRLLGASVRRTFESQDLPWHDTAWLRDLDGSTLARLAADSAVRITSNATLGDPGTGSMNWLYTHPAESNARIAEYLQSLSSDASAERLFWKGHREHMLTYDETLMTTTLTGIDNRIPIACILPAGRGEDLMLGDGLYSLHPQTMMFAFHWALFHSPEPSRYWKRPAAKADRSPPKPDWFISHLVDRCVKGCEAREPSARLHYLAARYQELASASDETLRQTLVVRYLGDQAAHLRDYVESRASGRSLGQTWQQDLSTLIDNAASRLGQPLELTDHWLAEFRDLAARYAAALRLWPELGEQVSRRRAELAPAIDPAP